MKQYWFMLLICFSFSAFSKIYQPDKIITVLSYDREGKRNKQKLIYNALEFPLIVCIAPYDSRMDHKDISRMNEQLMLSVRLWNKSYARRIKTLSYLNISIEGAPSILLNLEYPLFKLDGCENVGSRYHILFHPKMYFFEDGSVNPRIRGQFEPIDTRECHPLLKLVSIPFTCFLFGRDKKGLISLDLNRVTNNNLSYVGWEHIRLDRKMSRVSSGNFMYAILTHELGHALGLPHIPNTIMNWSTGICKDTVSDESCTISDQVIDYFIGYYVQHFERKVYEDCFSQILHRMRDQYNKCVRRHNKDRCAHLEPIKHNLRYKSPNTSAKVYDWRFEHGHAHRYYGLFYFHIELWKMASGSLFLTVSKRCL